MGGNLKSEDKIEWINSFISVDEQKEILDKTILLRDMESGSQEVIDYNKIYEEIKKRLDKINPVIKNEDKPLGE